MLTTVDLTVFYGTLIHTRSLTELEIITNGVLIVDNATGKIVRLDRNVENVDRLLAELKLGDVKVHRLGAHEFLLPGFVDTHAHAPQYVFTGSGMDLQLLEWLRTYVFPAESGFKSVEYAEKTYTKVVSRFLRNGTTTCSWFATIHLEACKKLVDVIERLGQRGYVGKVNMDQNSPDHYCETTETSLADTRAFIEYTLSRGPLVTPVITPRFAITCSTPLMAGLGQLAREYNLPIQSHLCENEDEIAFTRKLFPDSEHYTAVYDDHNLLQPKTYMAHCVHMTDDEIDMLAERNVGISHCANSNFSLHSGVCDVRRFLARGMKVGLGTDVAGGFAPSMLDAIRSSFFASKTNRIWHRSSGKKDYCHLETAELLYLATLGGARVLSLDDTIGSFEVGKAFDALWVDLEHPDSSVDLIGNETQLQKLEKFLYNGNDQCLQHVYVQGKRVAGSALLPAPRTL